MDKVHADELERSPERRDDPASTREALLADAVAAIDAVLPAPALVYGSPPPHGRDLDLIVTTRTADAAAAALAARGFVYRHGVWARFRGCTVAAVELLPPAAVRLSEDTLSTMLAEARPLPGLERIVVPAPHHELLLLARRLARAKSLTSKHRDRVELLLEADAGAWGRSLAAADAAGAAAIHRLRRLVADESGARVGPLPRRRPRVPRILGVSAPDPARAGRHGRSLAEAATALGYDGVVVEPGQRVTSVWREVLRALRRGGVVVVAEATTRRRWLAPPPLVSYVIAEGAPEPRRARVRWVDAGLAEAEACERIALDAWDFLARGGRIAAVLRRCRPAAPKGA